MNNEQLETYIAEFSTKILCYLEAESLDYKIITMVLMAAASRMCLLNKVPLDIYLESCAMMFKNAAHQDLSWQNDL